VSALAGIAAATVVIACVLVWLGVRLAGAASTSAVRRAALFVLVSYVAICVWRPSAFLVADMFVLATGTLAGVVLARMLGSPAALIAFALAAGIADAISFTGGLTRMILEASHASKSSLLVYLSLSVPVPHLGLTAVVGVGDLFVLAVFMAALRRLEYGRAAFIVPSSGLLIALGAGLALGGVPAVPMMSAAVIVLVGITKFRQSRTVPLRTP
jgi:hypothetical protein